MADDMWKVIHAERRALAADLAGLAPEQWQTPSLCPRWTVHDVLAHLVSTARLSPPAFLVGLAGAGFNFDRFTGKRIEAEKADGPEATLANFRAVETNTSSPPGPKLSWLGEVLVHGEDIRRPLGIAHDYPIASATAVTEFYAGSNVLIGGKRRVEGVTLQATDADWSHGSGPVVSGPARSLMMATAGRREALEDLTGPGVETLRTR